MALDIPEQVGEATKSCHHLYKLLCKVAACRPIDDAMLEALTTAVADAQTKTLPLVELFRAACLRIGVEARFMQFADSYHEALLVATMRIIVARSIALAATDEEQDVFRDEDVRKLIDAGRGHNFGDVLLELLTTFGYPKEDDRDLFMVRLRRESAIAKAMAISVVDELKASDPPKGRPRKSRRQPEKEVTKWVRQHWHEYDDNKKAVEEYCRLNELRFQKQYDDLNNDLRHKPLDKPPRDR